MNLNEILKGYSLQIMTDAKVPVILEIESVEQVTESRDLEPATRENDWWPNSTSWTKFRIIFTNGHKVDLGSIFDCDFIRIEHKY